MNQINKIIYLNGLSGSGKTTLAYELQKKIPNSIVLDGDIIRNSINSDLGFNQLDKAENIRRNNELIKLLYSQGFTIICAFMASIPEIRDKLFDDIPNIIKVSLITSVEVCKNRDTKRYYKNKLKNFAGIDIPFYPIPNPSIKLDTDKLNIEECINIIDKYINE